MDNSSDSTQVREQMAHIRANLTQDVSEVVDQARELADWRNFVRRHPWLCAGAAVAVGYLIVPSPPQVIAADSDSSVGGKPAASSEKLSSRDTTKQASLLAPLVGLAAQAILRSAVTVAGDQLQNLFASSPRSPSDDVSRDKR